MMTLLTSILLSTPSVHAAGCVSYFLRGGVALVQAFRGKEYMEEGRPIHRQLIAVGRRVTPRSIATAWMEREDRSEMTWGPGVDYWGPGTEGPEFIQTIPHWTVMTNAQIRPFVAIFECLQMIELYGIDEEGTRVFVEDAMKKLTAINLVAWDVAFPDHPIPPPVRAVFDQLVSQRL